MQPFTNVESNLGDLISELTELGSDLVQKAESQQFNNYTEFWVSVLSIPEYRGLGEITISMRVLIPLTYLYERRFSTLVEIKSKKINCIRDVDTLMRVTPETRLCLASQY